MNYVVTGLNGVAYVLHCISTFLTVANPFLFFGSTCIWMLLYMRVRRELDRSYLRSYALEQQVNYLVNNSDVDKEYFHYMQKTYKDLEDRKRG